MEKLLELTIRIFSDNYPVDKIQGIITFAHTVDNYEKVLKRAKTIYDIKSTPIIINGAEKISGFVGSQHYKNTLVDFGIKAEDILVARPADDKMLHTRNESIAYIQLLKKLNLKNCLIISSPFHQLRAFMTMVTIALEQNVNIKLYNCPVIDFDWNASITHSQGQLTKVARELIYEELNRIKKYGEKGDLVKAEDVIDYLNNRF